MADQTIAGVKLSSDGAANRKLILDKSSNAQWAFNNLKGLISELEKVDEKSRVKKFGIDNDDIKIFKEIRLGVVDQIRKEDPKGIGPDLFYYGTDRKALAERDRKTKAANQAAMDELNKINSRTPFQKGVAAVEGFGQGLSLNTRAAAYERYGQPGSEALKTVNPDDPYKSLGMRFGHAFGDDYTQNVAGIPGTLGGGGAAAGIVNLLSKALPQTRAVRGIMGVTQAAAGLAGGISGGQFTAGLAQKASPFNRLSPDAQRAITQATAGPERTLASAASQGLLFSPITRDYRGNLSMFEGRGLFKSTKDLIERGPQAISSGALDTPMDIAGRVADAINTDKGTQEFNKNLEAQLTQRLGRTPTRAELEAEGYMGPGEQQIQLALSLGLGGYTKHGQIFTGQHLFNKGLEGLNNLQNRVVQKMGQQKPDVSLTTPSPEPLLSPTTPAPNSGFKFNVTIPGLNQKPSEQARVTFDPGAKTASVSPRVDRIPDQFRIPLAKTLRDKVGQVNGQIITGVSNDGDFFVQTQQLDGSVKIDTKSYQELPDALRSKVKESLLQTKIDGKAIDADATFSADRGYQKEYSPKVDALKTYDAQYPVKITIDGTDVRAAVMEKVGSANVRVQLPSGNSLVIPTSYVQGDGSATGIKISKPPKISGIKDKTGLPVAYDEQGLDFYVPPSERQTAAETPGSWKEIYKFPREDWEQLSGAELKPGTVVQLENFGQGKDVWGVVLRPEEFDLDGEQGYGWRVQPLHDPRSPQIMVEHTGIDLVPNITPKKLDDAVQAGEITQEAADQLEGSTTEDESGTPVTKVETEAGTEPITNTSGAVVNTTSTSGAPDVQLDTSLPKPAVEATTQPVSTAKPDVEPTTQPSSTTKPDVEEAKPEAKPDAQPEAKPDAQPEANKSEQPTKTSEPASRPKPKVGSKSAKTVQPDEYTNFGYGEEFKQRIDDDRLPPEMRSDKRTDSDGKVNSYYQMTKGEEVTRQGNIGNVVAFPGIVSNTFKRLKTAFDLNVKDKDGNITKWNIEVKSGVKDKRFGQAEFKTLLMDEWKQSATQADVLSKYVDRWAVGWAKDIARLSGYNVNMVARALRIEGIDPPGGEAWQAWKSNYREQQVLNPTKANKELIAKLVTVFYTERLGGIAGLSAEQTASIGRPGATFTLQGNTGQVMHVALAMRGKMNYVTQVHEVNHLLVRSLYGPMYHEIAAAIRQSYQITGNQQRNTRQITPDVEEQLVTSLTNAIFKSDNANKVLQEAFREGGAGNDHTLTVLFNAIGQQMRESVGLEDSPKANDIANHPGWAVGFDKTKQTAASTPIVYQPSKDTYFEGTLKQDFDPSQDKSVSIIFKDSEGVEIESTVDPETLFIGQIETKLSEGAQRIVARWLGHWHDWTVESIKEFVPDIKVESFEPVTNTDIVRKNVGYNWWKNIQEYKNKVSGLDDSRWTPTRIRARAFYSYLGWLDYSNNDGATGYDNFLSYSDLSAQERIPRGSSKQLITITSANDAADMASALTSLIAKEKAYLEQKKKDDIAAADQAAKDKADAEAKAKEEADKLKAEQQARYEEAKAKGDALAAAEKAKADSENQSAAKSDDELKQRDAVVNDATSKISKLNKQVTAQVNKVIKDLEGLIKDGKYDGALELISKDLATYINGKSTVAMGIHSKVMEAGGILPESLVNHANYELERALKLADEKIKEASEVKAETAKQLTDITAEQLKKEAEEDFNEDIFGAAGGEFSGMSTLIRSKDSTPGSDALVIPTTGRSWEDPTIKSINEYIKKLSQTPEVNQERIVDKLLESLIESDVTRIKINVRIKDRALYSTDFQYAGGQPIKVSAKKNQPTQNASDIQQSTYTNVTSGLRQLMRSVRFTPNGIVVTTNKNGYLQSVTMDAQSFYKELNREIERQAASGITDYLKSVGQADTYYNRIMKLMRENEQNVDAVAAIMISDSAYANWTKTKDRNYIDVKDLTVANTGLDSSIVADLNNIKTAEEFEKYIDDNRSELSGSPMFMHIIRAKDDVNSVLRFKGTSIPDVKWSDAQYRRVLDDIKTRTDVASIKVDYNLSDADFVEPVANAKSRIEKLMSVSFMSGQDVNEEAGLTEDNKNIFDITKGFLSNDEYFDSLVDSRIRYVESLQKPRNTLDALLDLSSERRRLVMMYKEDLAFAKTNSDKSSQDKALEMVRLAESSLSNVNAAIKSRRDAARLQTQEDVDAMNNVFDVLSDIDDSVIYKFFDPSNKDQQNKIAALVRETSQGAPQLYGALNAKDLPEILQVIKDRIDSQTASDEDVAQMDVYRSHARALGNISNAFVAARDTYDRTREIDTLGNLTSRYVDFQSSLTVQEAVILDARRINMQSFRLGSNQSMSDTELQAVIGVGSAKYNDALYLSVVDQAANAKVVKLLTEQNNGVRPSPSALNAHPDYKVPLINKMNALETGSLIGEAAKTRLGDETYARHHTALRDLFAILNTKVEIKIGDKETVKSVDDILFTKGNHFTIAEKTWMLMNLVDDLASGKIVPSSPKFKHVEAARNAMVKSLGVYSSGVKTKGDLQAQAKNLRVFRKHVAESMVMPIQRDYVGTRPGGLVEVTTTTPKDTEAFAKAIIEFVVNKDKESILNKDVYGRSGFYQKLIKRINDAIKFDKNARKAFGNTRTVLSDAELFALADAYDTGDVKYTPWEKYAFVKTMIDKRDAAINSPLKEWLSTNAKAKDQLTVGDLNSYLDQAQELSEYDKRAFIGIFASSLSANMSHLKRYAMLTGHLPDVSDLKYISEVTGASVEKLQEEYKTVSSLFAAVGYESLSNHIMGSQINVTHYNRTRDSVHTHGIFVNLQPSELQGVHAIARQTWMDLESVLGEQYAITSSDPSEFTPGSFDALATPTRLKSAVMATKLADMIWGKQLSGRSIQGADRIALVSSKMPAANQSGSVGSKMASRMTPEARMAAHIHNTSESSIGKVLKDVLQGEKLSMLNESLKRFNREKFLLMYRRTEGALPSQSEAFKAYETEYARVILAAREEMVRSVNDTTYDFYDYNPAKKANGTSDYSKVAVYDRVLKRNVYEIDYVNGRVFEVEGIGKKAVRKPITIGKSNENGTTQLHQLLADAIFVGATPDTKQKYMPVVLQSAVNTPSLNPVPAVYWHGRYRINMANDGVAASEPMYMSTLIGKSKQVFDSVGSFDVDTENGYIKPVLQRWTMPDITGNTRVRVDNEGLPYFDGAGYTVTTKDGHRSGLFTNLIANGLTKEKALSIYAMTEHPQFKNFIAGDLIENASLRKGTSFVDQGRVVDAKTYSKVNKVIALHEFVRAVNRYMDSPTQENLEMVEHMYDETEMGRHLSDSELKAKAKSIVATQLDSLAYIKTATDLAASITTPEIEYHVKPYLAQRESEKQLTTGTPFTSLVFEDTSNTFMNMDAPGLRTYDLGSGLGANVNRRNQPYFVRVFNPYVHDAMENGVAWNDMQDIMNKAIADGHDGLVVTNLRPNLLNSERRNLVYTFDDSNVKPIDQMGVSQYSTSVTATESVVTPMFMNAPMWAPVTTKVTPVASSAVFVQPPKTAKEISGDVLSYAGDVAQGIARFPLSLDFAFVGIQGAKALMGVLTGRPYDTWFAVKAFGLSMQGMMPNTSITVFGKKIGFDKLGRRAWLNVYQEMRKDPYFELMRDLNVPLHFVNFEKNIEAKRKQIFQESDGKVRYEDIKLDMLDFDERGNMTDYFERVTPTTVIPLTGMFERQMSLNHDLLLFSQIKYQLQHNPMFKGLTNEQLAKRRDVKALINFLAMSVGDVQYSTNDKIDAAAGRWGKFIAAAPRWYLSNVLMNPIVNPAVTALYKAVPAIREKLGENYRGVGLYDYNLLENRALLKYQLYTYVGTAAWGLIIPYMAEWLGRLLGREDITGEEGYGKWRFGNWKMADSTGVWDFVNTWTATHERMVKGQFQPLPKPGDKRSTVDWFAQVSAPTLYKLSPVITKMIQTYTGVDVIGRPVYENDYEYMKFYEKFFSPLVKEKFGVDLGTKPFVRGLYTTSLSPTSWTAMYKTYYEADWQTQGNVPTYASDQALKQFVAAALGSRADYDQFVPQAFQGQYRAMLKFKRLQYTGPSMLDIINDPDKNLGARMITGEDKL